MERTLESFLSRKWHDLIFILKESLDSVLGVQGQKQGDHPIVA